MLKLLDQGLAIDEVKHPDFAPLNVALKHGRWKVAKHLLANQMMPHEHHCPPLIAATQHNKDTTQGLELVFAHTGDLDVTDRNGRTALMTACLLGHEKKVQYLLKSDHDIDVTDQQGMNAYLDAVISQSNVVLDLLLQQTVDVHHCNAQGDNALLLALQQRTPNAKLVKTLLEHKVDCTHKNQRGKSALAVAEKKHPSIFKLFVTQIEADKQMELPLFTDADPAEASAAPPTATIAVDRQQPTTVPTIAATTTAKTKPSDEVTQQWFTAIAEGNLGRINKLLVDGVSIDITDDKGCTGLIHAAGKGHRAVASFLIQNQADIEHRSANGSSPMSSAIMSNSRALVGLLLSHGAQANGAGPGGYPCLSLAASQWNEACLSMLLDAGADINTCDDTGMGLYHHIALAAEYYGNTAKAKAALRLVYQYGLDINTPNPQGNTALHILCGALKSRQYAADDSHVANIAHEMLKLGATPKSTNHQGFTALQYAKKHALLNTKGVILSFIDAW
nr:ankyrin repeat domain-containing protein [Marinicella sp. NBU2979]